MAVALNGLDFLPGLFSLGSFLFRFASGLARLRGMGLLRPVEDELSNIYTIYSFNRLSLSLKIVDDTEDLDKNKNERFFKNHGLFNFVLCAF